MERDTQVTNPDAALYCALAKAQGEFQPVIKNREACGYDAAGQYYEYRYADLDAVLAATRPALSAHGLATAQTVIRQSGQNYQQLVTTLFHEGGGKLSSVMDLPVIDHYTDLNAYGSALGLLRRYAMSALLSVAPNDDVQPGGAKTRQDDQYNEPQQQQSAEPALARGEVPAYSDEDFQADFETWKEAIKAGKTTPDRIIQMVSSRGVLTEEQRSQILSLSNP